VPSRDVNAVGTRLAVQSFTYFWGGWFADVSELSIICAWLKC
jgi:hypothetical protein